MIQKKSVWSRFLYVCVLCLFLAGITPVTALAAPDGASEAEGIGTSLYDVSTALTAYANNVVGSNTNDKHADHKLSEMSGRTMGTAGAFVGYGDEKKGFYAYIASNTARSVTTSSYDAWKNVGDGNNTYAYVRYGRLLADLGLDDTAPNTTSDGVRNIFGMLYLLVFYVSGFLPKVFNFVLTLLRILNPFYFLTGGSGADQVFVSDSVIGMDGTFGTDTVAIVDSAALAVRDRIGTSDIPVISDVAQVISEYFDILRSIGIVIIIPFFLVLLFAKLLMVKQTEMNRSSRFQSIMVFIQRTFFIVVGIPICAMCYTNVLDMVDSYTSKQPAAERLTACTFVDFQTWVESQRLGLPSGVSLKSTLSNSNNGGDNNGDGNTAAGSASADTIRGLRDITFRINKMNGLVTGSSGIGLNADDTYGVYSGVWNTSTGSLVTNRQSTTKTRLVANMLQRYQSSSFYQSSTFETGVNGALSQFHSHDLGATPSTENANSNVGKIYEMYDETNEASDWMNRTMDDNKSIFDGSRWGSFSIFANGKLSVNQNGKLYTYSGGKTSGNALDPSTKCGLSTISMYNYLSTSFGDSSISVYSANNSTSEYTKESHYSANLIGSGALRYLFAANCMAVLGIICVIGLVYCVGMLFSNLRRGFSLIMQIPGAMLGVLKSIAQIVVYVITMICELVGTVFLYSIVVELLIMVASIIEKPINDAVTSTALIGGRLAFIGELYSPETLYQYPAAFGFGFLIVTLVVCFLGRTMVKARRSVLVAQECAMCMVFRAVTFKEYKHVFDQWFVQRNSLYIWDTTSEVWQQAKDLVTDVTIQGQHTVQEVYE